MIMLLAEAGLRSILLAAAVYAVLKIFCVRDAQKKLTAWTFVLLAALAMPALMQFRVDLPLLPAQPGEIAAPIAQTAIVSPLPTVPEAVSPALQPARAAGDFSARLPDLTWQHGLLAVYLLIAGLLLARLMFGFAKVWHLARSAVPVTQVPTRGLDVRAHADLRAPMAFGSVILVPANFIYWTGVQQRAVLAHEGAHVAHHDFAVQALASLHKSVFWFSPLSWWLQKQLCDLAESISDDAAIADLNDRPVYAEILLGISQNAQVPSLATNLAIGMARTANIRARIERVISEKSLTPRLSLRARALLAAALTPILGISAATGLRAADAPAPQVPQQATPNPVQPPPPAAPVRAPEPPTFLQRTIPNPAQPLPPYDPVRNPPEQLTHKKPLDPTRPLKPTPLAQTLQRVEQKLAAMKPQIDVQVRQATAQATALAQRAAQQAAMDAQARARDIQLAQATPTTGMASPPVARRVNCATAFPAQPGEHGTVILKMIIGTDGVPRDVAVQQSSGFPRLDNAAVQCVQSWRYNPAMKDGARVEIPGNPTIVYAPSPLDQRGENPQPVRAASAAPSASSPVKVSADRVEINEASGAATWSGNVVVTWGTQRLNADKVVAETADRKITRFRAEGNVVVTNGDNVMRVNAASFDLSKPVDQGAVMNMLGQ